MKLHSNPTASLNTVTAYGEGWIDINAERFAHSVLVFPEAPVQSWAVTRFDQLDEATLSAAAIDGTELIVVGTGNRQRFIHPRILAALHQRGIGVESMDTRAACRTYNILMAEGRKVSAALLVEPPPESPT
ncbi:Mth938-like domain-containing protein [soil metagenome]